MQTTEPNHKSELVQSADKKTLKRAQWESFSFNLEAPGMVRVTNESHEDSSGHSYLVNVETDIPVACECKAFQYGDGPCKHMLAVAIREPVLKAAVTPVMADGGSSCPHDHPHCEGLQSGRERPELCGECWEVWAGQ